ncbi:hypothetical protein BDY19DRAFT_995376 [Irpex rosettiformis]|uniref:Uncharacterized protein n=1 Tax=Irpex rosettiformis TaxID=378272 RepID=A0ACB8TY01_9APHY|nr:hypothetical protein BDY19DRAFT_995376 [Irpex rosettiformis]
MSSDSSLSDTNNSAHMPPLQFKGEIMDFDLGIEIDHRKRRRNRTTQSCLNCHTSKRKCDRKRPCQRCIQLGLTGLCVYEVDDPALRDDPNIDETTRLRNRIAELESLVRELRGKPHPRWAEPNFCDGDASEKWHSRSTRRSQLQFRQRASTLDSQQSTQPSSPTVVKTEQGPERSQQTQLYRMSPSPGPQIPFDNLPQSYSHRDTHHGHENCSPTNDMHYSPSSSSTTSSLGFPPRQTSGVLALPSNDLYYHQPYIRSENGTADPSCSCLTNPAAGHPLISLTHQLQNTIELLRQLPEHATRHNNCIILKRITQLNNLMQLLPHKNNAHGKRGLDGGFAKNNGGSGASTPQTPFDALSTPESELLSPVSTSSHSSINPAIHTQDWPMPTASQYDSYFPVGSGENGMYHKPTSYHIN